MKPDMSASAMHIRLGQLINEATVCWRETDDAIFRGIYHIATGLIVADAQTARRMAILLMTRIFVADAQAILRLLDDGLDDAAKEMWQERNMTNHITSIREVMVKHRQDNQGGNDGT